MKVLALVNRVLLLLLGVSTGTVKLVGLPEEMLIFRNAGFSDPAIVAFGVLQIAAALLLLRDATIRAGSAVLGLTFVIATGVLFVNHVNVFGVASLLFIAMAALAYRTASR